MDVGGADADADADTDPTGDEAAADAPRAGDPSVAAVLDAAAGDRGDESRGGAAGLSGAAGLPGAADDAGLLRAAITVRPAAGDDPAGPGGAPPDADHPEFQSIVRQSVVDQIRAHADAHPAIEVCGVLVGTVYENPQASFVYIDGMIRGDGSSARSTQVTFTAETWQHVHKVLEERHPGKRIIGWYHTHPGFGIFLSEMDLFIQRHFFGAAWQVAFVLDPKSRESGMFAWRQGQVRRVEFVLDDASGPVAPEAMFPALPTLAGRGSLSAPAAFEEEPAAPVDRATLDELVDRVRVLEGRVRALLVGFAILLVAAIIWPLVVLVVLPAQGVGGKPAPNSGRSDPAGQGHLPGPQPTTNDAPLLPLK